MRTRRTRQVWGVGCGLWAVGVLCGICLVGCRQLQSSGCGCPGGHRVLAKYDDEEKPTAKLLLTGQEDGDNPAPQPMRHRLKPAMVCVRVWVFHPLKPWGAYV